MLTSGFRLMRLLGSEVRVAPCCIAAAAVLTATLGAFVLPHRHPGLEGATLWAMAVFTALGIYASQILHELGHAVAARIHHHDVGVIQLWLLGATTEVTDPVDDPDAELAMALGGPLVSLMLATELLLTAVLLPTTPAGAAAAGVLTLLGWANVATAGLSLVPVFPLDGGRALRALLQRHGATCADATRLVCAVGTTLGLVGMLGGGVLALAGAPIPGLWVAGLATAIRSAARAELPPDEGGRQAPVQAVPPLTSTGQ